MTTTPSLPDPARAARRANAAHQRIENAAAAREGRPARNLRAEASAHRRAAVLAAMTPEVRALWDAAAAFETGSRVLDSAGDLWRVTGHTYSGRVQVTSGPVVAFRWPADLARVQS